MKKVELLFYQTNPSPENTGLKHVLWEITGPDETVNHDWGFAEWLGKEWGVIDVPEGYTSTVIWWANTVNPDILTVEKSKIIRL